MKEPNSTLKRLVDKIALLDFIDNQNGASKLDIIVQVPYAIKNELRQDIADERRRQIEEQLAGSKFGVAFIDGTEKIIQLNRPVEAQILPQVEYLTRMLWSQLGMSEAVVTGTAGEDERLQYMMRVIEPFASAITDGLKRTFLTKTARSQGHDIAFIMDPFRMIMPSQLPDLADKLTRNEIMTSNEFRDKLYMLPSGDPKADELRNKNLNQQAEAEGDQNGSSNQIEEGDTV